MLYSILGNPFYFNKTFDRQIRKRETYDGDTPNGKDNSFRSI